MQHPPGGTLPWSTQPQQARQRRHAAMPLPQWPPLWRPRRRSRRSPCCRPQPPSRSWLRSGMRHASPPSCSARRSSRQQPRAAAPSTLAAAAAARQGRQLTPQPSKPHMGRVPCLLFWRLRAPRCRRGSSRSVSCSPQAPQSLDHCSESSACCRRRLPQCLLPRLLQLFAAARSTPRTRRGGLWMPRAAAAAAGCRSREAQVKQLTLPGRLLLRLPAWVETACLLPACISAEPGGCRSLASPQTDVCHPFVCSLGRCPRSAQPLGQTARQPGCAAPANSGSCCRASCTAGRQPCDL